MCVSVCVIVRQCLSVTDSTNWYIGQKNKHCFFFVWKFGFWPGEVMEKSWNFFLRFLWNPEIILWKYTMPEITFRVRILRWIFERVPKAWLWAHIQSFSLKYLIRSSISVIHKFGKNILETWRNVSETIPRACFLSIVSEGRRYI